MDENKSDREGFLYTYSAPTEEERREIEGIRSAYLPPSAQENKMERLRRLDSRVRGVPSAAEITTGVVGVLIFGGGFSLCLVAPVTGVKIAVGAVLCVAGIVAMALAKFVHSRISRRMKAKYGQEILKLSEELLGKEQ